MPIVENITFQYSVDKGETWNSVTPEENTTNNNLVAGENTLVINETSKHIMFRFTNDGQTWIDSYQEISDINLIYREKTVK
jgi:hypothetical protein